MTEQKNTLFEEKVPTRSKLAYGGAIFANRILSGLGLGPITFYYNIALGLSGTLLGLAWLIFIVWNAINDPLFGFLED